MENVLTVNFDDDTKAYTALTSLNQLDEQGQLKLSGAGVVVRNEDGHIEIKAKEDVHSKIEELKAKVHNQPVAPAAADRGQSGGKP